MTWTVCIYTVCEGPDTDTSQFTTYTNTSQTHKQKSDLMASSSTKNTRYFSCGDQEDWGLYFDMDCTKALKALNAAMEKQMNAAFENVKSGTCSAQDAAQKVVDAVGIVQDKYFDYGASDSDAQRLLCMEVENAFEKHLGVDVDVERPL